MSARSWSVVIPLLAAAAAMAGVYTYHRMSQTPAQPAVTAASTQPSAAGTGKHVGAGFSFNAYDTPREMPALNFIDASGAEMTLADFRGKSVLLNLWATWCVPCREEMPTLDRLQASLGGDDFLVLALSLDQEGPPVVKEFYDELGLKHLGIYVDDRILAPAQLGVIGVPATLLIDREGREIGRKLGPAEWDSAEVEAEIRRHVDGSAQ